MNARAGALHNALVLEHNTPGAKACKAFVQNFTKIHSPRIHSMLEPIDLEALVLQHGAIPLLPSKLELMHWSLPSRLLTYACLSWCTFLCATPLSLNPTGPQMPLPGSSSETHLDLIGNTSMRSELDGLQLAMTHGANPPRPKKDNSPTSPSSQTGTNANSALPLSAHVTASQADQAVIDMAQAFKRMDRHKLTALLPLAQSSLLAPWAAYWELRARLDSASTQEVKDFFKTYANTYQEDRLRNDWLLLLGSRRDWTTFASEYPAYRMRDDRELLCYGLLIEYLSPLAKPSNESDIKSIWSKQKEADDGCKWAIDHLFDHKKISALELWQKARTGAQNNRLKLTRDLVQIADADALSSFNTAWSQPHRFLKDHFAAPQKTRQELIVLALIRAASADPDKASELLKDKWEPYLSSEQRHWLWGVIGMQAALKLNPQALGFFERSKKISDMNDEMLGWYVRTLLKQPQGPQWAKIEEAIKAMSADGKKEPAWTYWLARALLAQALTSPLSAQAKLKAESLALLESIASLRGFYEQLALEELGKKITLPPKPPTPSPQELASIQAHVGLKRALFAIALGLRSEGVREWNYATSLVNAQGESGRMSDTEMMAASQLACSQMVYDRCIFTSERAREFWEPGYLFPTPHKDLILSYAKSNEIDPAFIYGLMRQESRFVTDIKSHVGAAGLMQVMPQTAKWTAKKIGLSPFTPDMIKDKETNVAIGTGYMRLVLESFESSYPLAAAAYNAGPSRSRRWREGPELEAAIWIENIPFNETRDYVKKVISNTTVYAAIFSSQAQSIKARLPKVGPRKGDPDRAEPNPDLP
ncbi:MAG: transglycosylase SLT domain-containing protein [Burkholderiaceae bacterium]